MRLGRVALILVSVGVLVGILAGPAQALQRFSEYPVPTTNSQPEYITSGPDGNLWFTENLGNKIGRITTGGVITEYAIPTGGSYPEGIAAGPDGNLWFTENGRNKIGRITTGGAITEYPVPTAFSGPVGIAAGPDGRVWFAEFT